MKSQEILAEELKKTKKGELLEWNILAGRVLAEICSTSYGPSGSFKVLTNSLGEVVLTKDGVTIFKELDIGYVGARLFARISKALEGEVGDGTKGAVILVGELLRRGKGLLEAGVHPTIIAKGYELAAEEGTREIWRRALKTKTKEKPLLEQVARTAINPKIGGREGEYLARLAVEASTYLQDRGTINLKNLQIDKKTGLMLTDSKLIRGVVIKGERSHFSMPKRVYNRKIALIGGALKAEVKRSRYKAEIRLLNYPHYSEFQDKKREVIEEIAGILETTGVGAVFCNREIDETLKMILMKMGVYAVEKVKRRHLRRLSKATGASIVEGVGNLTKGDLGYAGKIWEERNDITRIYVEECRNPRAICIQVRGGGEQFLHEGERALKNALGSLKAAFENGAVTLGGGATEIEVSRKLRAYSRRFKSKEQLAVLAFADSLEILPFTLARNSGMNPVDTLLSLRVLHKKGERAMGVNVNTRRIENMLEAGIVEPAKLKAQIIKSAAEVASMVLKLDEAIFVTSKRDSHKGFVADEMHDITIP